MTVIWQRKVFGRREGQVEDIDLATEPRLEFWLSAGLVIEATDTPDAQPDAPSPVKKRRRSGGGEEAKLAILNEK